MKKNLFVIGILITNTVSAQLLTSGGSVGTTLSTAPVRNVGIGTNNPESLLDVRNRIYINPDGPVYGTGIKIPLNTYWTRGYHFMSSDGSTKLGGFAAAGPSDGIDYYFIGKEYNNNAARFYPSDNKTVFYGNIGIGNSSPKRKLHISGGDIYVDGPGVFNFGDDARFVVNKADIPSMRQSSFSMGQYGIASPETVNSAELWISGNDGIRMFTRGFAKPRLTISNDGRVGIGSINPDAELTVNGNIHSKEVKVDLSIPADYVFEKYYTGTSSLKSDYIMPTLDEVEKFTKENNHLPNLPSAKQIQKEGIYLSEMTNLLLQKIEELTLYTIEQDKQLKVLNAKIEKLEEQIKNSN